MSQEQKIEDAYLGGGCFWCIEAAFENIKGVLDVASGYSGGFAKTANYESVSTGKTKHAEICKISYDPNIVSFQVLLEVFFLAHDPTTLNIQGNDIGSQYRSVIFYDTNKQKEISQKYIKKLESENIYKNIQTELSKFKVFYLAENYHQNYFSLNPKQPYCQIVIDPKVKKLKNKLKKYYLK